MRIYPTALKTIKQWIDCDKCFVQNHVEIIFQFTEDGVEADDVEFVCSDCNTRQLVSYVSYFTTSEVECQR